MTATPLAESPNRPAYLSDADDVPHAIPDVPLWSENYLSQAYSPANGVGVYMHHGTAKFDPTLWNEIFVVYLPGDEYLVAKGFARNGTPTGPGGPALTFRCDEPFTRWTKTFSGAARKVSGSALRAGTMTDGGHGLLEMTLTYTAGSPAFDLGNIEEQNWGSSHYHQHCHVTGHVTFGSQTYEIDGTGLRDHSWGVRDTHGLAHHEWSTCLFPSGWNFSVFTAGNVDGTGMMQFANVGGSGAVTNVELLQGIPAISSMAEMTNGFEIHLGTPNGRKVVQAEFVAAAPLGMAGGAELVIGADPGGKEGVHLFVAEGQVRFTCNGEVGYGYTQRSFLIHPSA